MSISIMPRNVCKLLPLLSRPAGHLILILHNSGSVQYPYTSTFKQWNDQVSNSSGTASQYNYERSPIINTIKVTASPMHLPVCQRLRSVTAYQLQSESSLQMKPVLSLNPPLPFCQAQEADVAHGWNGYQRVGILRRFTALSIDKIKLINQTQEAKT